MHVHQSPMTIKKNLTDHLIDEGSLTDLESGNYVKRKTTTFNCGICYEEDMDANDAENPVKMLSCNHTFCSECFKAYYETLIEKDGKSNALKCPESGCAAKPTKNEIKDIISANCFDKYKKFKTANDVARDPNLLFCSTVDCETILDARKAQNSCCLCGTCGESTCVKCKDGKHQGLTCEENNKRKYN